MQPTLWTPQYDIRDGAVTLHPDFYSYEEALDIYNYLRDNVIWQQDKIKFYGKEMNLPRLTSWYGDSQFTYSGITMYPTAWTPNLLKIKEKVENKVDTEFNGVLLNYYRDGNDSVAWHSDDEPEWGINPTI